MPETPGEELVSPTATTAARAPRAEAELSRLVRLSGARLSQRTSHARSRSRPRGLVPAESSVYDLGQREQVDDGGYREVHREMFRRVIRRGLVPLSSAPDNEEGGDSRPTSDDERFASRVLRLEAYRSRPASQGSASQLVTALDEASALLDDWSDTEVTVGTWASQPRGLVSEWHTNE